MATEEQKCSLIMETLGLTPSPLLLEALLPQPHEKIVIGGVRAAKSVELALEFMRDIPYKIAANKQTGNSTLYWLVGPDYKQTEEELRYLYEWNSKLGWVKEYLAPRQGSRELTLDGNIKIVTRSAAEPATLASVAPDRIGVCEAGQISLEAREQVKLRSMEKNARIIYTGCLSADTYVATSLGVKQMGKLCLLTAPTDITLASPLGPAQATLTWRNPVLPTKRITFKSGLTIEGTLDHRIKTATVKLVNHHREWAWDWQQLQDIEVGQRVPVVIGANVWGANQVDDAYLLGLYTAEGSIGGKGYAVAITTPDSDDYLISQGFKKSGSSWWKSSIDLVRRMQLCGHRAIGKQVPEVILSANRESVVAYLQGLFDGDGYVNRSQVGLELVSEKLIRQVQFLLINLGIMARVHPRKPRVGRLPDGRTCNPQSAWCLEAYAPEFVAHVGFQVERKQAKALAWPQSNPAKPGSRARVEGAYVDIVKAVEASEAETFDLHVPGHHSYLANGLISHNTMEDDLTHNDWAWYLEDAMEWQENPTRHRQSFSLPSWANLYLYGDCRRMLADDPELAEWCPDLNHPHSGEDHPIIRREKQQLDPYTFARKVAAIPTGVQYQAYPQATEFESDLLRPMTFEEYELPVITSAGGIDYGTIHPTVITAVQVLPDPRDQQVSFVGPKGIAWVREAWYNEGKQSGDYDLLARARQAMATRYSIYRWMTDPNERYMAKSFQGEQTSYAEGARSARMGLVSTRLNLGKLKFDLNGPGVKRLLTDLQKVHYHKTRSGKLELVREGEDGPASLEDAIEMIDRYSGVVRQKPMRIGGSRRREPEFSQRM